MFAILPAIAFALFISSAYTQVLISPTLPVCAQQCTILLKAQNGCVPPAALVTSPATYQSCFCQSAFLTTLPSNPVAVCPLCSPVDLEALQTWFEGLCAAGAGVGGQQSLTSITATPSTLLTSTTSVSTRAPPAVTANNVAGGSSTISTRPPPNNRGWMASHWRWVLMLIVLLFGFILVAIVGRYFHRRYHRNHDGAAVGVARARSQPDLGTWGPGQSAHDFGASAAGAAAAPIREKGKQNWQADAGALQQSSEKPKGSRRLKKGWLSGRN